MPPEFWQAVDQFNQGEFYDCHDTLEALWMEEVEPLRRFYQGILQIAVACYHLSRQNWQGATMLLGEGIGRLKYYQPVYGDIDVASLIDQSLDLLYLLQETGPENVAALTQQMQPTAQEGGAIAAPANSPTLYLPKISPAVAES